MNCATHQQTPAVAYCRTCGKPLCENCKREVHGLIYCEDCIASRVQGAPAGAGVVNPQAPHPGVALVLGIIPGVGAMTDTLEFVKNLWGGMKIPGMAMPSLSVDDVNKQIADRLNLSLITVKLYRRQVMEKMQAETFADLVKMWERLNAAQPSIVPAK